MGRVWFFSPWIWTQPWDLFCSIAYEQKWQLASCKPQHEKPCASTCTLCFCHGHEKSSSRFLLPLLHELEDEWTYVGQSCLGQSTELQWETKSSSQAQPRASERHPAHVSVSNNKWLLFKDPEFWGDLLCSTSKRIHLISGVPVQKNYQ